MNLTAPYFLAAVAIFLLGPSTVRADIADRPEVASFIHALSARRHFDEASLFELFRQVEIQPKILDNMSRPAEAKPWWEYRKIFLTEANIQAGAQFWTRNQAALDSAFERYGVEPEMIVAILGVETRFGQIGGKYRVIDALSTLAFDYPRRADFFRKELEAFLVLCRSEGMDPAEPRGSYAGAMGMPQFMPSSFRQYAADSDDDQKRDIWTNPADAIASVANYFSHNGWHTGETVAAQARLIDDSGYLATASGTKPDRSVAQLRSLGIEPTTPLSGGTKVKLLEFDVEAGTEYWLGLHNFHVITRYNHSPLYAMAAFQLGREILGRRGGSASSP